jgi:hypothetical protein
MDPRLYRLSLLYTNFEVMIAITRLHFVDK